MYLEKRNIITHLAVGDEMSFTPNYITVSQNLLLLAIAKEKLTLKDKMPPKQTLLERKFVLFVFHQIF